MKQIEEFRDLLESRLNHYIDTGEESLMLVTQEIILDFFDQFPEYAP